MARQPQKSKAMSVTVRDDGSVGLREASFLLGVTQQTLRDWLARGCPSISGTTGRGKGTSVIVADVIGWRIAETSRPADMEDEDGVTYNLDRARAVDMHYRAISRQAAARKELGSLVAVDLVADAVEEDYQRVRSRLGSVPSRVSVQAAAENDASVVRALISKAISDALENLSEPKEIIDQAGGDPNSSVHDPLDLDGHEDEEGEYGGDEDA